jgi:signal transduction histidine kinase
MRLDDDSQELELIAHAFQTISRETSYHGLAKAFLEQALSYSGASRGGVLLSTGGELLDGPDTSFSSAMTKFFVSDPLDAEFQLPADLRERVLGRRETVSRQMESRSSALVFPLEAPPQDISQLFLPLVHQERTIGVLYLESSQEREIFEPRCVWVMSMLASQTAVSFESVRLFEALREANRWMIKSQAIGQMGSYRWNTRTLLSRGSREIYRILGLDLNVNPVPFEAFRDRVHLDDLPALEQSLTEALSTRSPFRHEYRVVHKDGTTLHVIAVGRFDFGPTGDLELEGIITDVTEQKAAERALTDARTELARASSLASVGEIAGSIIHEINQPLTGILMSGEACLRWLARGPAKLDDAHKSADRVIEQSRRAGDVIKGLKTLVRDAKVNFTRVDINDAIGEVLVLSKRDLELSAVTLRTDFDRSSPTVEADRVQLQQVVLNLARNAIDAMAGIEAGDRILTASSRAAVDNVSVRITDTGIGIDPASRERLFDALFTTKKGGLGLGLSICRKIIAGHGGRLWVEEGKVPGTTFAFMLPLRGPAQMSNGN